MTARLHIFGQGPVAFSAALTAQALGFEPQLIRRPAPEPKASADPRAWSLRPASLDFLSQLGLPLKVKSPVQAMEVWHADECGTRLPGELHFEEALISAIVPNGPLREEFEALLQTRDVKIESASLQDPLAFVKAQNDRAPGLALICDPTWAAQLSSHSKPRASAWAYDQIALTAPVCLAEPHGQIARQVFLPSGPLALLPLPDLRAASLIWSLDPAKAAAARALPDLSGHISKLAGLELSLDPKALGSFPLQASHANTYVGPGFALLGDAAHRVHPLAGQGLNLAFEDVGALFNALAAARAVGTDLSSVFALTDYERARRPRNEAMRAATDQLKHIFGATWGPMRFARALGLSAFNASPLKFSLQSWMSDPSPLCAALNR